MEKLDNLVAEYIEQHLLEPKRLGQLLSHALDRRTERAARRKLHITELRKRAAEADAKLKRLVTVGILAHEFIHGRNLGWFAVALRSFRFASVAQKIGAKLFPHVLLFQNRTERTNACRIA
jgi:hypothetical protein